MESCLCVLRASVFQNHFEFWKLLKVSNLPTFSVLTAQKLIGGFVIGKHHLVCIPMQFLPSQIVTKL